MTYPGGCHCGRVRFEVTADLGVVYDCNCSLCSRTGYLHWYVKPEQVRLLTQKISLATYQWRGLTGGHYFCPTCGVPVMRLSTQYPPPVSVNARCLDGVDVTSLQIHHGDGRSLP